MPEAVEEPVPADFSGDMDLYSFFLSPPHGIHFDFGQSIIDPSLELGTIPKHNGFDSDSIPPWEDEIEQFFAGDVEEDFLSDVFADGSSESKPQAISNGGDDDAKAEIGKNGEKRMDRKQERKMRNRDSAMKSRERKKIYVKNLEMKSKFLESECRRLDHLFRCCAAENLALRHRLHKERAAAIGVSQAKQESAVLFVESLPLGSLFWLVSIVFLFLVPNLLAQSPKLWAELENARGLGAYWNQEMIGTKRLRLDNSRLWSKLIFSRRYKALRTKIKICSSPLASVFA